MIPETEKSLWDVELYFYDDHDYTYLTVQVGSIGADSITQAEEMAWAKLARINALTYANSKVTRY